MTILIAEDEGAIARILVANLQRAGYTAVVVEDGPSVLTYLEQQQADLILLDVLLPGIDGFELCRHIRQHSRIPIIMVTACRAEAQRLKGFDLGADDYVCKPFSPSEVVARVRSLLRRTQQESSLLNQALQIGELSIRPDTHEVTLAGNSVDLTGTEFKLLTLFARAPNRVFSRDKLLDILQGDTCEKSDRTVDSHIRNLRRKLGCVRPDLTLIQSIYGEGYRLGFPFQRTQQEDKREISIG